MTSNQTAITFIKAHENCRLQAYQDLGGVWTCGWGTTGPDIGPGTVWTQAQADQRFLDKYLPIEAALRHSIHTPLSEGQEAALISLAYNDGPAAVASSVLLILANRRDWIGTAKAFKDWDHIGQMEVKGLLLRRLEEAVLFLRSSP